MDSLDSLLDPFSKDVIGKAVVILDERWRVRLELLNGPFP